MRRFVGDARLTLRHPTLGNIATEIVNARSIDRPTGLLAIYRLLDAPLIERLSMLLETHQSA